MPHLPGPKRSSEQGNSLAVLLWVCAPHQHPTLGKRVGGLVKLPSWSRSWAASVQLSGSFAGEQQPAGHSSPERSRSSPRAALC